MKSTLYSVNTRDFFKGLIIAVLTPVFVIIQQSITASSLVFDWKSIAIAAISGLLAYLSKNFFTDTTTQAVQLLAKQNVEITEVSTQQTVTPQNVKAIQEATKPDTIKPPSNP